MTEPKEDSAEFTALKSRVADGEVSVRRSYRNKTVEERIWNKISGVIQFLMGEHPIRKVLFWAVYVWLLIQIFPYVAEVLIRVGRPTWPDIPVGFGQVFPLEMLKPDPEFIFFIFLGWLLIRSVQDRYHIRKLERQVWELENPELAEAEQQRMEALWSNLENAVNDLGDRIADLDDDGDEHDLIKAVRRHKSRETD